jgi:hypothetical protein
MFATSGNARMRQQHDWCLRRLKRTQTIEGLAVDDLILLPKLSSRDRQNVLQ